jgi:hypothetical protein
MTYTRRTAAAGDSPATMGTVHYDPVVGTYSLAAPPSPPWTIEQELDFSYPEPSSEMWHVCDDLHFTHKMLRGDGSITAKVESIAPHHCGTQASVMIRDTLDPTSPQASVAISSLGDIVCQYRPVELGAAKSTYAASRVELPHWIRLTRQGNLFTAQHSRDGVSWEDFQDSNQNQSKSIEIPMGETAYVGLAFTSCDPSRTAEARISNVITLGIVSTPGPFDAVEYISLGPSPSTDRDESR